MKSLKSFLFYLFLISVCYTPYRSFSDTTTDRFSLLKESLSIDGNIDILYFYSDFNTSGKSEDTSDFIIDQIRLNISADISDYVSAYVGLQFEDYKQGSFAPFGGGFRDTEVNDGGLQVDEAYITLGGEEGFYSIVGKQYLPFGNIQEYGNFINDTLARKLYETRDTGIVVGHRFAGSNINFFAFNGQLEEQQGDGADNKVDAWGGSISYDHQHEDAGFSLGFSYLNNIFHAQNSVLLTPLSKTQFNDNDSQAFDVYGVFFCGPMWFSAEYVSTFNNISPLDVPGGTVDDAKPESYSFELAYTVPVMEYDITLAGKYEANSDLEEFDNTIEDIMGFGVSSNIFENTLLTFNYENQNFEVGYANVFLLELHVGF